MGVFDEGQKFYANKRPSPKQPPKQQKQIKQITPVKSEVSEFEGLVSINGLEIDLPDVKTEKHKDIPKKKLKTPIIKLKEV